MPSSRLQLRRTPARTPQEDAGLGGLSGRAEARGGRDTDTTEKPDTLLQPRLALGRANSGSPLTAWRGSSLKGWRQRGVHMEPSTPAAQVRLSEFIPYHETRRLLAERLGTPMRKALPTKSRLG